MDGWNLCIFACKNGVLQYLYVCSLSTIAWSLHPMEKTVKIRSERVVNYCFYFELEQNISSFSQISKHFPSFFPNKTRIWLFDEMWLRQEQSGGNFI